MKQQLRSEHIRYKLLWAMGIIIASILVISVPLTVSSYHSYKKAELALSEILVLQDVAALANSISRERAPANKAMSSTSQELPKNLKDLVIYREGVDKQFANTLSSLRTLGFNAEADELEKNLKQSLTNGRKTIDEYIRTPHDQRTAAQLDRSIKKMFNAWDSTRLTLEEIVSHAVGKQSSISDNYTLVLLLADLRDQAGRVASNIMAAVTYDQQIPDENVAHSLQTQYQANYLWGLINTLQPRVQKTEEYYSLHKQVQTKFLNQGINTVSGLIQESREGKPYSLTGTELTKAMVDHFATVVNLQTYLLKTSRNYVEQAHRQEFRRFIFTLIVSIVSFLTAIFTLVYARKTIFMPLIAARQKILELSQVRKSLSTSISDRDEVSLFEAIQRLQDMLQQRDVLEFQLRNIANTDILTGVSNRLALKEYIRLLEMRSERLSKTGLIIIDIDDFKKVNDRLGHIVGDQAIKFVADKLKQNVRSSDLIVRYGGDEFLIIIDNIGLSELYEIADKIRREIVTSGFFVPEVSDYLDISVSAGIAVGACSWIALLERADKSLFKVKAEGKNAVSG